MTKNRVFRGSGTNDTPPSVSLFWTFLNCLFEKNVVQMRFSNSAPSPPYFRGILPGVGAPGLGWERAGVGA